jgi:glutathione S-transferase
MLELYHYSTAVCAAKVRVVLAEKRLPWMGRIVKLFSDSGQHDPEYLKLNPNGVVPTLIDDGKVVIESTVIMEYLDETFPEIPLRPDDSYGRARMRLWLKQLDEGLHYAVGVLSFGIAYRFRMLVMAPAELERHLIAIPNPDNRAWQRQAIELGTEAPLVVAALHKYQKLFAAMEKTLQASDWLAGDRYSLAEAAYAPYFQRLETLQMAEMWTAAHPRLADWYRRVEARPSFREGILAPAEQGNYDLLREKGAAAWPMLRAKLLPAA